MPTRTKYRAGKTSLVSPTDCASRVQLDAEEALGVIAACAVVIQNRPQTLASRFAVIESAALKARRAVGMSDDAWRDLLKNGTITAAVPDLTITPIGERVFSAGVGYEIIEHIGTGAKGIRCKNCNRTSWNPNDVRNLYCGHCSWFHSETRII